jgi:hypothetical protein
VTMVEEEEAAGANEAGAPTGDDLLGSGVFGECSWRHLVD